MKPELVIKLTDQVRLLVLENEKAIKSFGALKQELSEEGLNRRVQLLMDKYLSRDGQPPVPGIPGMQAAQTRKLGNDRLRFMLVKNPNQLSDSDTKRAEEMGIKRALGTDTGVSGGVGG